MSNKPKVGKDGIYDARQLGTPKMVVLGFQHNCYSTSSYRLKYFNNTFVCRLGYTFVPLSYQV